MQRKLDAALYDETQATDARMSTKSPVGALAKEFDEQVAATTPEHVLTLTEIPRARVRDITDDCPPREGKWLDQVNGMDYDKYLGLLFVDMLTEPEWPEKQRAEFYAGLGQSAYDKVRSAIEDITSTEVDVPKYSAVSVVNQARESIKKRSSRTG